MAYLEIKQRNGNKYYYRVLSIRKGNETLKKRIYLGRDLTKKQLIDEQQKADEILSEIRRKNKKKAIEKIKPKIVKILKKYGIIKAGIFGSYARGEQTKDSDIDLIIQPSKPLGFKLAGIHIAIKNKLNKRVDIITYKSVHPLLKKNILNDEVAII